MTKAFVFDMDGVLIDTESICDRTWVLAGKDMNLDEKMVMDAINRCRGCNKSNIISILKQIFGESFESEKFLDLTGVYFGQIEQKEGIKPMLYARECLKHLKKQGYRLALASSTRGPAVERHLSRVGLLDYFETRVTGDMVVNSKPDPEIYQIACNKLGLTPDNCIAIEDSLNGLISAKKAGMTTIMVPDRVKPGVETAKVTDILYEDLGKVIENF